MERRRLEFSVGIFMIVGLLCLAYLALTLGHLGWGGSRYDVNAMFPTVSGLKNKAAVTMAGVNIGEVRKIQLKDGRADVTLSINNDVNLEDDDRKKYIKMLVLKNKPSAFAYLINTYAGCVLSCDLSRGPGPKLKSRPNGSHDSGLFLPERRPDERTAVARPL